ncbi:MAG: VacJ family lipoprotein [Caulobacteraceae bacterium]
MSKEFCVRRTILTAVLVLAVCGAGESAARSPMIHAVASPDDPWESFNRRAFAFNQEIDRLFIRPAAFLARGLTPGPLGRALHNILSNLGEPVVIANDLLQHRIAKAASATARLVVNTTAGLFGAVDIAARIGLPHHPNSFADTLGRYGAVAGPYLYLPLLGPTTVRDLVGAGFDTTLTPLFYFKYRDSTEILITLAVLGGLDQRAEADDDLNTLLADAADPYATLRSTYLQLRQGEIDAGRKAPAALPDIESVPATPTSAMPDVESEPPPETAPEPHATAAGEAEPVLALDDPRRISSRARSLFRTGPGRSDPVGQQPTPFEGLPREEGGQSDRQVAGAF